MLTPLFLLPTAEGGGRGRGRGRGGRAGAGAGAARGGRRPFDRHSQTGKTYVHPSNIPPSYFTFNHSATRIRKYTRVGEVMRLPPSSRLKRLLPLMQPPRPFPSPLPKALSPLPRPSPKVVPVASASQRRRILHSLSTSTWPSRRTKNSTSPRSRMPVRPTKVLTLKSGRTPLLSPKPRKRSLILSARYPSPPFLKIKSSQFTLYSTDQIRPQGTRQEG